MTTIPTGLHWVDAPCPRCGAIETVAVKLSSLLQVPDEDQASIRVRLKAKPVDHDCGQRRLDVGLFAATADDAEPAP